MVWAEHSYFNQSSQSLKGQAKINTTYHLIKDKHF